MTERFEVWIPKFCEPVQMIIVPEWEEAQTASKDAVVL